MLLVHYCPSRPRLSLRPSDYSLDFLRVSLIFIREVKENGRYLVSSARKERGLDKVLIIRKIFPKTHFSFSLGLRCGLISQVSF